MLCTCSAVESKSIPEKEAVLLLPSSDIPIRMLLVIYTKWNKTIFLLHLTKIVLDVWCTIQRTETKALLLTSSFVGRYFSNNSAYSPGRASISHVSIASLIPLADNPIFLWVMTEIKVRINAVRYLQMGQFSDIISKSES